MEGQSKPWMAYIDSCSFAIRVSCYSSGNTDQLSHAIFNNTSFELYSGKYAIKHTIDIFDSLSILRMSEGKRLTVVLPDTSKAIQSRAVPYMQQQPRSLEDKVKARPSLAGVGAEMATIPFEA